MKSVLSLGSNQGDREYYLNNAIEKILCLPTTTILKKSSIIETKAWGNTIQPDFLNMTIMIETELSPIDLLHNCLRIEKHFGRIRKTKWAERTLDIDIIFYGDIVYNSEELTIPHALMHVRNFVLDNLIEICPDYIHPVFHKSIIDLKYELVGREK